MPTDEAQTGDAAPESETAHPEGGADPYYPDDSLYPGDASGDQAGVASEDQAVADTAHPEGGADPYYPDDSLYPGGDATSE